MVESAVKRNQCENGKKQHPGTTIQGDRNLCRTLKIKTFIKHNRTDKDSLVKKIWTGFTSWFGEKCSHSTL